VNALVTGAGGFLGRYIVEQLVSRGDRVRALCRREFPELDALGVETVLADLRDRRAVVDACRGMDCVFHAGGIAGMGFDWRLFYNVNTLGTKHVVEGCIENRVRKLVFTSSPSVTFGGADQCGVDESVPYPEKWLSHYSHSKALAEQLVLESNGVGELATCSLRPHLIWGPRDRHLIPRLLKLARSGKVRRIGDGTNLIDIVYVENAAEAHLLAADALQADSIVAGRAYFISQGEPVYCWQWIDELLALAGLPPVRKSTSLTSARTIGGMYEAVYRILHIKGEPPMTRFLAAQLAISHYFDITRAQEDFGYRPRISTAEGMKRLAAHMPK